MDDAHVMRPPLSEDPLTHTLRTMPARAPTVVAAAASKAKAPAAGAATAKPRAAATAHASPAAAKGALCSEPRSKAFAGLRGYV
jgi:hypothetical protein